MSERVYLVSACLLGLCTRYDGKAKPNGHCLERLEKALAIPVCPEQLAGLPTPREAADIVGGNGRDVLAGQAKVLTKSGIDISAAFLRGAHMVLSIAKRQHIEAVLLKARSPSCGVTGNAGVTAALLHAHGYHLEEF